MQVQFHNAQIATVRQPLLPPSTVKPGNAYWEAELPIPGLDVIDPGARSIHDVNSEMLVLSRKPKEGIVINDDVRVYISPNFRATQPRLIVDAPNEFPIFRINDANEIASTSPDPKEMKKGVTYYDIPKLNKRPRLATITIVRVQGNKVRLGIEADPATPVHREEVHNEIIQAPGDSEREIGGLVIARRLNEKIAIFQPAPDLILPNPQD